MTTHWRFLSKAGNDPAGSGLDPYFGWAEVSAWRGLTRVYGPHRPEDGRQWVRLIVQAPDERLDLAWAEHPSWKIPPIYRELAASGKSYRHFTADVDRVQFADFLAMAAERRLVWELAAPFRPAERAARASRRGYFNSARDDLAYQRREPRRPAQLPKGSKSAQAGAIAVIDHGCPFLNHAFAEPGVLLSQGQRTRIAALWDQGDLPRDGGSWWSANTDFGYGRCIDSADIDALLALRDRDGCAEEDLYKDLGQLVDLGDARRRVWQRTHGAHVLDVAGGYPDPLGGGDDDAAGSAPLLFVQLPAVTAADASGGSLSAHVLDAVHFCLQQVRGNGPLVINLSYGTTAADGKGISLLERALDELQAHNPQLAIVLAAGNARDAGCVARRRVCPKRGVHLRLDLAPGDSTDTFVEFWYERPESGKGLEIRVRAPGRDWSDWLAQGESLGLVDSSAVPARRDLPVAWLCHAPRVPQGQRSLVLLALAPTAPTIDDPGPLAPAGRWDIELRCAGKAIEVDACIEWDQIGELSPADRRTAWAGIEPGDLDESLSSLVHGQRSLVVGAMRRGGVEALAMSGRSSSSRKPHLLAVAEESASQPGIHAAAVASGERFLAGGTSTAAAVVTRRVYNLLRRQPSLHGVTPKALAEALVAAESAEPERGAFRGPALRLPVDQLSR